ncbi:MAG: SbcC/MukB-like Walker B domain-containing protein, partial [Acidobacteriota bacterium]
QQLTRERREGCLAEQARADARMEAEHGNVEREASLRQNAIGSLQRLIETGLLSVAEPALPVSDEDRSAERSVKRSVEICRALEARLSEVESDDGRWQRQQRDVHNQFQRLQETLAPHGYPPVLTVEDDLFVVTAPFQGQHQTLDVFRSSLHDEVSMRDRVLAEREREVIENHLIGEVALHLHQRLRDAEELVLRINQQIESRPTSTGMILRFRWQPLGQEFMGLDGARRLLMSEHGLWSAQDRKAVGDFLQGLIDERRREDDTGTWQEHLRDALDYRRWHEFGVERRQDDRWRRLTRRTHGTGSGGEKALALTVPQFAAAAAHYDTADKRAPRLILLDEAFVGIDKDMRAKCMGLLHAFDLDFVMTSEREWACYPTLPGVAIYQLATRPNIDAVAMSRWLWNGRERQRDNPVLPPASLPPKALDERQADLFSEAE